MRALLSCLAFSAIFAVSMPPSVEGLPILSCGGPSDLAVVAVERRPGEAFATFVLRDATGAVRRCRGHAALADVGVGERISGEAFWRDAYLLLAA